MPSKDKSKLPKKQMRYTERKLASGLGEAVAKRTYLRTDKNEVLEKWSSVAERVAYGNTRLISPLNRKHRKKEYELLKKHIANASILMSGRHLQHGDKNQANRNMEVFTNCSTASSSFLLFYLLLNGSGVGRAYDDDLMVLDWDNMPIVRCVLDESHTDFVWGDDESVRDAKHKYAKAYWFKVPDTREGWAEAVEKIETMAFEKKYKEDILIIDFSDVRPKGSLIGGMQNRPASGPRPLIKSIQKLASVKNAGLEKWKQTMFVDHYLSECVLVGGARRAARIATKVWTDPGIFDFISIKRGGFLWSANNSIAVDEKFWKQKTKHSKKVLESVLKSSYYDKTGEPGFVNQHRLVQNDEGFSGYLDGKYAVSKKYKPAKKTVGMLREIARRANAKYYTQIPNPCGEITLNMLGGYCVIADVVPYYAPDANSAEEAFRAAARA
ncbi:MAG: ribonucleoside-diphosphate reductase, partial [Patescibacteria group bacterium]